MKSHADEEEIVDVIVGLKKENEFLKILLFISIVANVLTVLLARFYLGQ